MIRTPMKILAIALVLAAVFVAGCTEAPEQHGIELTNIGASPVTPWSDESIEPEIHVSAYVHPQASVIGDVTIGKKVMISPQASVRGDEGMPIYVGDDTNIQDGVVIHALETKDEEHQPVEKNLVEVDGQKYAVHVGDRVSLAHQCQVHGPASVGDDTFVGMQALVFKAQVGSNCVIEPGAKIIGVTIADGKYVSAGMVVTSQEVADNLPEITSDYVFKDLNKGVVHVNEKLAEGYNEMEGQGE